VDRGDPLEQALVEVDLLIGRGRQLGRPLLLDRLHLGAAQARGHDREQDLGAAEVAAGALERGDGVGEARRLGVGDDRLQLGGAQRDARRQHRRERGRPQPVERRRPAVAPGPGGEQRLGVGGGGQARDLGQRGDVRRGSGRWRHDDSRLRLGLRLRAARRHEGREAQGHEQRASHGAAV
jgi:hypothetical protein